MALFDSWMMNDKFALGCRPKTYGVSTDGKNAEIFVSNYYTVVLYMQ